MRRRAGQCLGAILLLRLASCGTGGSTASSSGPVTSVELPFGLTVVDGSEPIGRPAVYRTDSLYHGEPAGTRTLQAAFSVTDDDPVAVVRAWVEHLDRLALDEVTVQRDGTRPEQWMAVAGTPGFSGEQPPGDRADLQLWATTRDPVLLVTITVTANEMRGESHEPTVKDTAGHPAAPKAEVGWKTRREGDELFTEQGDTMHLPAGTTSRMPTIPTFGGTGGSTSVLAATDAAETVAALLREAKASSRYGEVTGPTQSETDGLEVVTGSFVIPAGGWGFNVVGVRAPGDGSATLYVTSGAD